MKEQVVKAKPISPLKGVLVVALIVAGLLAASMLSNALAKALDNNLASGLVFLLAIGAAIYLMREHIMEYRYTVNEGMLYLERTYGQRTKVLDSFPVLDITEIGEKNAMREKHAEVKNAMNLTLRGCDIAPVAIVYSKNGRKQMAFLQPDEQMLSLLWDEEARRRSQAAKWGDGQAKNS